MASIINATVTSPGGLVSTGDNTNELKIQTGETDAVTVNSSQVVAFNNPIVVAGNNISADNSLGFRNRIINGDMRIAQRGTAAVTASGDYPVDRFIMGNSTDGAFSAQQDSSAPAGFVNSVKITTTTADGTLTTTQNMNFRQRIEGTNTADLGWGTASAKTVTLSFWVRSSLTGTFGGALSNSAQDRSYPYTYTISAADIWEYKTVTISGDTTGTWLTDTGTGIILFFGLGAGPDRSGTAGAWAGAQYTSATGAVSVIGTLNATWYVTGVQLEVGSVATPFERRPYGTELALCQRYCQVRRAGEGSNSQITFCGTGNARSTTAAYFSDKFSTTMRTFPSLTVVNATSFQVYDTAATATTSIIYDISDRDYMLVNANVASGLTSTRFYTFGTGNGQTNGVLIYSAEL